MKLVYMCRSEPQIAVLVIRSSASPCTAHLSYNQPVLSLVKLLSFCCCSIIPKIPVSLERYLFAPGGWDSSHPFVLMEHSLTCLPGPRSLKC